MDDGIAGPVIMPLPKTYEFDNGEITDYITEVLRQFGFQDSYGLLAAVQSGGGEIKPTIIFGIPGLNLVGPDLPPPPNNLGLLVQNNCMLAVHSYETTWSLDPVKNLQQLDLQPCSVGLEGSLEGAGSFGGFLKRRFQSLLRYTSLSTTTDHLRIIAPKDYEAQAIVQEFRFHKSIAGPTFVDPTNPAQVNTGIFSGARLGSITYTHFGVHSDLLHWYDQQLRQRELPRFSAHISWLTRIDCCIFNCNPERYGGNIYDDRAVSDVGDLYPSALVEKVGRTTRRTMGTVNPAVLVIWDRGSPTFEVAIIGIDRNIFAGPGDSGGCVFENESGTYKAAGLLMGKNLEGNIAYATPLRLLLQTAGDYEWA
ncbi:hypothetical protein C7212DRAFT_366492 [Tuber magnatum]|uniref:Peptidase S1 domain-containing protein n=1 Tax=Tuber magnatum TaxID=42249 RepID=A0A317SDT8_9PEZI|nr:hypothetical protein C7212DRAFT_366492 [Tuber magnatum]